MRIAICDDERSWIIALKSLLDEYFLQRHIEYYLSVYENGVDLTENKQEYDIIFLDYKMADLNGIETARKIREQNKDCTIIFVSSYPNVAIDAFEVDAYRFLTKPIIKEKLFQAINDHRKKVESDDYLVIKSRTETTTIKSSKIIFCEAVGKHTVIHTENGNIQVLKNIKEIKRQLPKNAFFRCHKAYIVSFARIKNFSNNRVVLEGDAEAFISRNYISAFKAAFHEYILKYNMEKI